MSYLNIFFSQRNWKKRVHKLNKKIDNNSIWKKLRAIRVEKETSGIIRISARVYKRLLSSNSINGLALTPKSPSVKSSSIDWPCYQLFTACESVDVISLILNSTMLLQNSKQWPANRPYFQQKLSVRILSIRPFTSSIRAYIDAGLISRIYFSILSHNWWSIFAS